MLIALIIVATLLLSFGLLAFTGAPFVPTLQKSLRGLFKSHLKLTNKDVVVDMGSGSGRVLKEAILHGAGRAIGYEIHPILVLVSRFALRKIPNAKVELANIWTVKLPKDTSVVYAFSVRRDIGRIYNNVQSEVDRLGHDVRLVCYGDSVLDVEPDEIFEAFSIYRISPLHHTLA